MVAAAVSGLLATLADAAPVGPRALGRAPRRWARLRLGGRGNAPGAGSERVVSRRAHEPVLASALLLLLLGALLAISLTCGPPTRMVPVPVAEFSILLIVGQLNVQSRGSEEDLHVHPARPDGAPSPTPRPQDEGGGPQTEARATMDDSGGAPHARNPIQIDPDDWVRRTLRDRVGPGDTNDRAEGDRETLPVVAFPDESWYCGRCDSAGPTDAIAIVFPDPSLPATAGALTVAGKVDPVGGAATAKG